MAYYNNSTKPTTNYISSPFDDDPAPVQNNYANSNQSYEKDPYSNPYNPDYLPQSSYSRSNSNNNSYNQSSLHSTQEHALSPSFSEKALPAAAAPGVAGAGGQTFAMQHVHNNSHDSYNSEYYGNNNYQGQHNPSSYYQNEPNYYNGYDEDRPSLSNDTAPMRPHTDLETSDGLTRSKSGITRVKYQKEKSKYLPCFPCIRSTCGRFTCCFCLILLLIIIVLAIVIVTVFKLPTVDYKGTQTDPKFTVDTTGLSVNLTALIDVTNPNPIGFNFESIVATAYYPGFAPSIGGGTLTHVDFPSHSTQHIVFPISASYHRADDPGLTVVNDVLLKCGKTGAAPVGLTLNYDLKLTIKIIGIPISLPIKNQHINLDCPSDIGNINGLGSILGNTR
ncbi:hypothetical protein BGZ83_010741 [Gryganskiella cystojenkinii]|nr:hypothetical protein BGZ83_010741 [Gryganskiella cystojenkinii]